MALFYPLRDMIPRIPSIDSTILLTGPMAQGGFRIRALAGKSTAEVILFVFL